MTRCRTAALFAGVVLLLSAVTAAAQWQKPRQASQQSAINKAQALTQDQIAQSRDLAALQRLRRWYRKAGNKDHYRWTMKRLTELLPGSLQIKLQLAASYAADDMKSEAYDLLLRTQKQGFGLDLSDAPAFEKIHGTQVWDYIVKNLNANLNSFGEGSKAFDLPADNLLFNALAWDPVHDAFLVGSAHDGGIYHADKNGKLSPFIQADSNNKLYSILDLAVDAKHKRLWVATTSLAYFEGYDADNAGKSALVEFDLRNGKLLHRYPLQGREASASVLALASDGTVYLADSHNRAVYTVKDGKLDVVAQNPRLTAIAAMAVSDDGEQLYLADPTIGLVGFDTDTGKGFQVAYNPAMLVLPGIVDMHVYKGTLVVIEPGMQPERVMRLKLSDDGRKITSAMPLEVANPLFNKIGNGTVVGNKLYFIANNQGWKYDQYGLLRDGAELKPVHVFESNLDFEWDGKGIPAGFKKGKQAAGKSAQPGILKKTPHNILMQGHGGSSQD